MAYPLVKIVAKKIRRGRGIASRGAKSGRGMKGQRSRAGAPRQKAGWEGGQTPLYMRLPKEKGTKHKHASQVKKPAAISVNTLKNFSGEKVIGPGQLNKAGLCGKTQEVKIIGGRGDAKLEAKLTVRAHKFTESAKAAIESAGGKVEVIG